MTKTKTRYRIEKRLWKPDLVVLQIYEEWTNYDYCYQTGSIDSTPHGKWRDAKPEDLINEPSS